MAGATRVGARAASAREAPHPTPRTGGHVAPAPLGCGHVSGRVGLGAGSVLSGSVARSGYTLGCRMSGVFGHIDEIRVTRARARSVLTRGSE